MNAYLDDGGNRDAPAQTEAGAPSGLQAPPAPEVPSPFPPMLLVEDDAVSAGLVQRLLAKIGLANPIVHVVDGRAALAWLEASLVDGVKPALLLLDVDVPFLSGIDVLRWVRRHPELATVPVVMLTASADMEAIKEAYHLGVASYLVKPVGSDAVAAIVRGLPSRWALLLSAEQ